MVPPGTWSIAALHGELAEPWPVWLGGWRVGPCTEDLWVHAPPLVGVSAGSSQATSLSQIGVRINNSQLAELP